MQCNDQVKTELYNISKVIHVDSYYSGPRDLIPTNDEYECSSICQRISTKCSLLVIDREQCQWYDTSATYGYRLTQIDESAMAFLKLCPTGSNCNKHLCSGSMFKRL